VLRLVEAFTSLRAKPSCGSKLHPATGHSQTESGDKSPHSKSPAVCCGSFLGVWPDRYAIGVSPHPQPLSPETSSLFLNAAVPMDWLGPIEYWSGEKACLLGEGSQIQGALRAAWRGVAWRLAATMFTARGKPVGVRRAPPLLALCHGSAWWWLAAIRFTARESGAHARLCHA
jgi:hypothetical protein